ncbi:MAG: autotransporter-associated beta strand repeat-containing protein [Sphingomonas sp.]|nr:autotransporter-associated beta strand repeat-containing protein [Sphingomonas sp.]MDX3884195.1 autotransporter-associated beta strand repeat-containing protein [Sphingomonas sp.]
MATARGAVINAAGGTLETQGNTTLTYDGLISGAGALGKSGAGTLVLTAANQYAGGTKVTGGVVQITSDANLGAAGGALTLDGGTLRTGTDITIGRAGVMGAAGGTFDTTAGTLTYEGVISGNGGLTATGAGGNLVLTGANSYRGATTVDAGYLIVNGDQTQATGLTTVGNGARLSGKGIIGGSVQVGNGGIFAPGSEPFTPATLTINGDLAFSNNSNIFYDIQDTAVGGSLNDLTIVKGNLTLDGVINVHDQGQDLGPGVYRIINYSGTLIDNGLEIGQYQSAPGTSGRPLDNFSVQTAIPGQVNLINTTGLSLNYWDGRDGPKNNGAINGGDGQWVRAGEAATSNWTDADGGVNAPWSDGQFAIFQGSSGIVTISHQDGAVTASGMQFDVDGYILNGEALLLVDSSAAPGEATIRVGNGGAAGMTATINAQLTGDVLLRKTDAGTLVLNGVNSYTGGTRIEGGVIQIASDQALGVVSGSLTLDSGTIRTMASMSASRDAVLNSGGGTVDVFGSTTLTLNNAITGVGALTKAGDGTLQLLAGNSYAGGTTISAGKLQLGNGGTTGSILGDVINNAAFAVNRSDTLTFGGTISGTGRFEQAGTGTTILTADSRYTGGTTISAGALQLGNGGLSGGITGDIVNNGTLVFNRGDMTRASALTLDGVISGTGGLVDIGSGITVLTGNNSYKGTTDIRSGYLFVNGDQSEATGLTTVAANARLSGHGTIGGNVHVADNGILAPGYEPFTPATLTINGDLVLSDNSNLFYNIGDTSVGGRLNDLTIVHGNLTLDGVINVLDQQQNLGAGVYRIINYDGDLIDRGLRIGTYMSDPDTPSGRPFEGFSVQTSIRGQVNLINTTGVSLNYWDGADGPKNDGIVQGGDGRWVKAGSASTSNWTDPDGRINAPWADGQFAVFVRSAGTVTIDHADGQVTASGMQFGVDGYVLDGAALTLVGSSDAPGVATIRVGDGTTGGAGMTATINAELTGAVQVRKTDAGTLVLNGVNTYTGGTLIEGGVIEISNDASLGAASGALTLDGGTIRVAQDIVAGHAAILGANGGTIETQTAGGTATTLDIGSAITGNGALTKAGSGILRLTADSSYTGGTTISAGTLQLGNGGTTGSILGDIVDNGVLAVNRSNDLTLSGIISGSGSLEQAGTGRTVVTAENTYTGGTTISAGTLQIGDGGTTGHIVGDILNNGTLIVNRSDTKLTPGKISGTGNLIQAGSGTLVLQADNDYTGGTSIALGILQLGDGGTSGSIVGDVENDSILAFNRSDTHIFAGSIAGTGELRQIGTGTTILTGASGYRGGTFIQQGTLQIGDGGTTGSIVGDVFNDGTIAIDRQDDLTYIGSIVGTGSAIKRGGGTLTLTGNSTYTGGTTIEEGVLRLGDGGTSGSILGDITDNGRLVIDRSDALLLTGTISGSGSFEQAGTGRTILQADNSYTGGTTISGGVLEIGNGGTTGSVLGDIVDNATLIMNRADTVSLDGTVSGTGQLIQDGLGTLILTGTNSYEGGTAIEAGVLQISSDANLGAASGGLRMADATLRTTADIDTDRATVLAQGGGVFDVVTGTTLAHGGDIQGAGGLTKIGGGTLRLDGTNGYKGPTNVSAGTLLVDGDQSEATERTTVASGATLGGGGTIGGSVDILSGGILAPGGANGPGTLTINGGLNLASGTILNYDFGAADVPGGPLNDLAVVKGDLVLDGTINISVPAGGRFTAGVYRVFDYAGALINNGLDIGIIPANGYFVQTSVANEVNLVVTDGLTFRFWDGDAGPKNDGAINGGNGVWQHVTGNDNWTDEGGTPNAGFTDTAFAVFQGDAGTVTVDASLGDINVSGMQFTTDGYVIEGDPIHLAGSTNTIIRVGDGTTNGIGMTTTIASVLTGDSTLAKTDVGILILQGTNDYTGGTTVAAGALYVDGNQGAANGPTSVSANATLGGAGTIGGSVTLADGAILTPGSLGAAPGMLTIGGDLALAAGSTLDYSFGQAGVVGGPFNDLTVVGGDVTLDGTIDVTLTPGGALDPGVYRVISYGGALVDNGLAIGSTPSPGFVVQTSVAKQVNLVNTSGLTLNYWDGAAGGRNDGAITGGDGVWQNRDGNDNWTTVSGTPNAPFADASFAVFMGQGGTVTVDGGLGPIAVSGMQFAVGGYAIEGDAVDLVGDNAVIRVGDGTAAGAQMVATIDSVLGGTASLAKSDLGTLILTAANNYTGGTAINGGVIEIASDRNLGAAAGALSFNGGTLRTTADIVSNRATTLGLAGGTLETAAGTSLTFAGAIGGGGGLTKAGGGTLLLTADNGYAGGTTIAAGTLQLGNGGASGAIQGDIANNGTLVVDRSGRLVLGGVISGTGAFVQAGTGTTVLTGANSYAGPTTISSGTLLVNGDQSAATGATAVAAGATLGGTGAVGGNVTIAGAGMLAPGDGGVGTLTINGDLALGSGSSLKYDFGQANVVGGPLNDLTVVKGDLVLDGTIDVALAPGGSIDPGIYRVISYAGDLTNAGLEIGAMPSPGFLVQTSIAHQVNLVNTAGLTLDFWDGAAGPKNDGVINGGDGVWQASGNDNWTTASGTPNAPFQDAAFAVFQGTAGAVTVDTSLGPVNVSGIQFATDGYGIEEGSINLVGAGLATIRVGDGTADGAGMTATIGSVLAGGAGLAKTDLGTLILSGQNSYAGGTAINGGVLQISGDANLGAAGGALAINGATLRTTADLSSSRATTLGAAGGTIETAGGTTFALDGTVGGDGGLTKIGEGTLTLGGANSYAGGTLVNAGTLRILGDANLGAAAGGLTLDGGTLNTTADIATARAFTLAAAGGTIDTAGGTALTLQSALSGPGALAKAGDGTLILLADNDYAGPTNILAGTLAVGDADHEAASIASAVTVGAGGTLGGYGTVNGAVDNRGTIAVADAVARFAAAGPGQFTINGTLTNAGLADLAGANAGNRLIVSSYVGQGGILHLNSVLEGDASPTDQLVIAGGTATGSTGIRITNAGGLGAATPGNGIEVVVAAGGATTAATAFALDGRAIAGPYEYKLFRGGRDGSDPESWFLRSELEDGPPEPPLYRPEVPTYTVMPSMALMYGRDLLGTLHDRVGDEAPLLDGAGRGGAGSGVWGRFMAQRDKWDAEPGGVYNEGPAFRANVRAFQVGVDLWRGGTPGKSLTVAGLYGAVGWNEGIVKDHDLSYAGQVKFDAYTVAGYATHYGPGGWYVDGVVQATWYKVRAGSVSPDDMKTDGTGIAVSLETGYPVRLGGGFSIEPQAQLIYQHLDLDDSADMAADVQFDKAEALTGRMGLRLLHNGERPGRDGPRPIATWLRANVWREFNADPRTSFSSEDGPVPFRSNIKATWAEFGAGVSTEVTRGATLFGSGSWQTAFGQETKSWGLRAGLRFNW